MTGRREVPVRVAVMRRDVTAQRRFFATLDRYTLADLLERRARLAKVLAAPTGLN